MKTEKEIRAHRDALRKCLGRPCDCNAHGHAMECMIGGKMMGVAIELMSWILDENGDMDRMVEEIAVAASEL